MAFGSLKGTLVLDNANNTANPQIGTGSVSVVVGDLVFVLMSQQTNLTASGVTDNLGNSYSAQNAGTDLGNQTGRTFYSRVTVAGILTEVRVATTSSSNDSSVAAIVIEGPVAVSPLDANPANATTDITSPFDTPPTGTLAQADEIVIGWGVPNLSSGNAVSATSPNLLGLQIGSTNTRAIIGYQAVSSTSTVTPRFTCGANPTVAVWGTASFKKDSNPNITSAQGNVALSTVVASVLQEHLRNPAQSNVALSAVAPIATVSVVAIPVQGDVALSTVAATVFQEHIRLPAQGNVLLSTIAPSVAQALFGNPDQANIVLSTVAPTALLASLRLPAFADVTLSATAPTVSASANVDAFPAAADPVFSTTAPTANIGGGGAFDVKQSSFFAVM